MAEQAHGGSKVHKFDSPAQGFAEALTAEALLLAAAVFFCGANGLLLHLAALYCCSFVVTACFPEPSAHCRLRASTGLLLGTVVLPIVFAVRAPTIPALSVAFRLTWWSGLLCNGMLVWSRAVRPKLQGLSVGVIWVAVTILVAALVAASGDAHLLPALAVCATCQATVQVAMPRSFTIGEAVIVAELCAVLFHVMTFSVVLDVAPLLVLTSKLRKIIAIGLFAAVGITAANLLLARVLKAERAGFRLYDHRGWCHLALTVASIIFMLEWMSYSIGENSLQWLWTYISSHTATPLKFVVYYLLVLVPALSLAPSGGSDARHRILVRKYFHVLALVMFVPTIVINIRFMALAFAVALAVFMVMESLRIANVPFVVAFMNPFMRRYIDDRDAGVAVLTHIYLLTGCALPVFFTYFVLRGIFSASGLLIALSGVAVTGLGDAMASYFGIHFGRRRWSGSKKTMEGTTAMVLGVLVFQAASLLAVGFHNLSAASWARLALADLLVSLLEAKTDQIDNLILPLYHIALLQLV